MDGRWTVALNDGPHTITANLPMSLFFWDQRLSVYFDGSRLTNKIIWSLLGTLYRFDSDGHQLEIRVDGFGVFGQLALYVDGQKAANNYRTGMCSRCGQGFYAKIGIRRGETVLPPPGTNWAPFDKRYIIYRCPNCGHEVRETATIWD